MNEKIEDLLAKHDSKLPILDWNMGGEPFAYFDEDFSAYMCRSCAQKKVDKYVKATPEMRQLLPSEIPVSFRLSTFGELQCFRCTYDIGSVMTW